MKRADPELIVASVGRRIAEVRETSGRTQEDVAHALRLAPRNYQRVERGEQNLTIKTLVRIANELGVKPAEFWTPPTTGKRKPGRPPKRMGR